MNDPVNFRRLGDSRLPQLQGYASRGSFRVPFVVGFIAGMATGVLLCLPAFLK